MKECSHKDCNLEVFENSNKCILHCEKDDWIPKISNEELKKFFSKIPIFSAECKTKLKHLLNDLKIKYRKINKQKIKGRLYIN